MDHTISVPVLYTQSPFTIILAFDTLSATELKDVQYLDNHYSITENVTRSLKARGRSDINRCLNGLILDTGLCQTTCGIF
jgi:hypothetical protein